MRSPWSAVATGSAIHCKMLGGIQAGSLGRVQSEGSLSQNLSILPFDSSSARVEPTLEHLVTFWMNSWVPKADATLLMAATKVVQSEQEELYPFFQIATEPALSTQIVTGRLLHIS